MAQRETSSSAHANFALANIALQRNHLGPKLPAHQLEEVVKLFTKYDSLYIIILEYGPIAYYSILPRSALYPNGVKLPAGSFHPVHNCPFNLHILRKENRTLEYWSSQGWKY
jgi:hypothetical protein